MGKMWSLFIRKKGKSKEEKNKKDEEGRYQHNNGIYKKQESEYSFHAGLNSLFQFFYLFIFPWSKCAGFNLFPRFFDETQVESDVVQRGDLRGEHFLADGEMAQVDAAVIMIHITFSGWIHF